MEGFGAVYSYAASSQPADSLCAGLALSGLQGSKNYLELASLMLYWTVAVTCCQGIWSD